MEQTDGRAFAASSFTRQIDEMRWRLEALRQAVHASQQGALETPIGELQQALDELSVAEEEMRQRVGETMAAQRALESERRRYQDLFEFAPDGYMVTDPQGTVLEANGAAHDMLGVVAPSLLGKPMIAFVAASDRQAWLTQVSQLPHAGRVVDWELLLQPRNRPALYVAAAVGVVRDETGQVTALRWLLRDVSRRKRAERTLERHSQQLLLLHEIDQSILAARSTAEIADVAARRLRRLVGCARASVVVFDYRTGEAEFISVDSSISTRLGSGTRLPLSAYRVPSAHHTGEPVLILDLGAKPGLPPELQPLLDEGIRSALRLPLLAQGQLIGNLNLGADEARVFTAEVIEMSRRVAASVAVALQHARLNEETLASRAQLRALSRRLVETQEDERRAVVRELHDGAGQVLASLQLRLGRLQRSTRTPTETSAQLLELIHQTDGVLADLHRLAVNLRPASLDRLGLAPALRSYVEVFQQEHNIPVSFLAVGPDRPSGDAVTIGAPDFSRVDGSDGSERLSRPGSGRGWRFSPEVETALFRIVQEALANVAQHAHATQASVVLEWRPAPGVHEAREQPGDPDTKAGTVLAIIEDDGVGFVTGNAVEFAGQGLIAMRERAEMLGGQVTVESGPGIGTTVFVEVPYERANPDR